MAWLPKYTHFVKCYLERFASNSDPEKWTTNVAQRKKHLKRDFNNTWHSFVNDVTKHVFLNGEGLQTLILGIFTAKMLPKQCKSLICILWLEMRFIFFAISLINKSRDPFPFIYRLLYNVNTHTRTLLIASEKYLNELEMYLKELDLGG